MLSNNINSVVSYLCLVNFCYIDIEISQSPVIIGFLVHGCISWWPVVACVSDSLGSGGGSTEAQYQSVGLSTRTDPYYILCLNLC